MRGLERSQVRRLQTPQGKHIFDVADEYRQSYSLPLAVSPLLDDGSNLLPTG